MQNTEVIDAALDLFWQKGYTETSMAEIVAATGMNRYALYTKFGSKREVFLAVLDHYFEWGRTQFEPILKDRSVAPHIRMQRSMERMVELSMSQENGCFMCHVAVEHSGEDPVIEKAVSTYFDKIVEMIEETLIEAEADGTLNPAMTPRAAADLVFAAELSMGVHAKAGGGEAMLQRVVAATITALFGAPGSGRTTR